jgi:hypothetical protein
VLNIESGVHQVVTNQPDTTGGYHDFRVTRFGWTRDGQYLMYAVVEYGIHKLKVYDTKSQTNRELFSSSYPFIDDVIDKNAFNVEGYVGIYVQEGLFLRSSYIDIRTEEVMQLPDLDHPLSSVDVYWKGNNKVWFVPVKDGVAWRHLDANTGYVLKTPIIDDAYAVSEDGNYIAVSGSRVSWLLDAKTGKARELSDRYADHLTFSPDNHALVFIDMVINIYDINGDQLFKSDRFPERNERVQRIFWSGDSKHIIMVIGQGETTGSFQGRIALFDRSGNHLRDFTALPDGAELEYTDWIPCP